MFVFVPGPVHVSLSRPATPLQQVGKQAQGNSGGAVAIVANGGGHGAGLGRGGGRGARARGGRGGGRAGSLGGGSGGARARGGGGGGVVVRVEGTALVLDAGRAVRLGGGVAGVLRVALREGLLADKLWVEKAGRWLVVNTSGCGWRREKKKRANDKRGKTGTSEKAQEKSAGQNVRWASSGGSTGGRARCRSGTGSCRPACSRDNRSARRGRIAFAPPTPGEATYGVAAVGRGVAVAEGAAGVALRRAPVRWRRGQ